MIDIRSSFRSGRFGLRLLAPAVGAAAALALLAPQLAGAATQTDTSVANFGAGTPGTDTYVSDTAGGELILTPTVGEEFSDALLPAGWSSCSWSGPNPETTCNPGSATVTGGSLHVDGNRTGPDPDQGPYAYGAGRSLEFVATFGGSDFQHVGFGQKYTAGPWAMFSVKGGGTFNARTNNAAIGDPGTDTLLPSVTFTLPHRYRIEWDLTEVRYYVDGLLVATHTTTFNATTELMRPLVSDLTAGGTEVAVDWLHMSPYTTSGTFASRVFDAGQSSDWGALSRNATTPTGTAVALRVRTGDTATPDASWSAFSAVLSNGADIPASSRYLQYRAELTTSDATQTPTLSEVTIAHEPTPPPPPPAAVTPTQPAVAGAVAQKKNCKKIKNKQKRKKCKKKQRN